MGEVVAFPPRAEPAVEIGLAEAAEWAVRDLDEFARLATDPWLRQQARDSRAMLQRALTLNRLGHSPDPGSPEPGQSRPGAQLIQLTAKPHGKGFLYTVATAGRDPVTTTNSVKAAEILWGLGVEQAFTRLRQAQASGSVEIAAD